MSKQLLDTCLGSRIEAAASSLENFAVRLSGDRGIIFEASGNQASFRVAWKIVDGDSLPDLHEAVCSVDWSWIAGSTIKAFHEVGPGIRLELDPAGPLTISTALWEGKPFLSFQPYRPAKK
ncbi:MAG: hypothetical protein KC777_09790 [Cyanobacteria bacterium HKST-UBA02]|nr:hypothetical protein [Cyanobacteria bacterium HKST-UBA02]